jgi:hypothetical protein
MDKIKFNDGTFYEINDGASLGRIEIPAASEEIGGIVDTLCSKDNLDEIQFLTDDDVSGEYTDMKLTNPVCHIEQAESGVVIVFGLEEKSDIEKRLDDLEDGQETQDGAIADLGEAVSEIVEGE